MKRDLSHLFDHFLAEINRYTNLLVKICEPLSDLDKIKAKNKLIKLCGKFPIAQKSKISQLLNIVNIPLSGKKSEVQNSLRRICEKELSITEKSKTEVIKHLTTICEPLSDLENSEVYESFVLKICATWETFVDDLLALCLSKDTSRYSEYIGTVFPKRPSKELCGTLISGYRYLDFRKVSNIKGLSKNILVSTYNPFLKIPENESKTIDEFFLIRNYIAHRSRVAKRLLSKLYQDVYHLQQFHEPGVFLLSQLHKNTEEVRFGQYISVFINAANTMALHLKVYE